MLRVIDVRKIFNQGSINEKVALNGVSLHLHSGDFATVIGGNGAGKSTFLNVIAGTFPIDQGDISIDGVSVSTRPEYRRATDIGRVFQDPLMGTAASMTIEENLAMANRRGKRRSLHWGITSRERDLFRGELSHLDLGLQDRLKTKVGLLSGGQRQALTILMATIIKPKLLLLDEHTAALDPKTAPKVLNLTEKIVAAHSLTTLMITHNMKDALKYGNRLIMMHEGRILVDLAGEEKQQLEVEDLLKMFEKASGGLASDRLLLAN